MKEEEYIQRIKDLEAEVAREKLGKELYKLTVHGLMRDVPPFDPPTRDEIEAMVNGPRGKPIIEIISELEREAV